MVAGEKKKQMEESDFRCSSNVLLLDTSHTIIRLKRFCVHSSVQATAAHLLSYLAISIGKASDCFEASQTRISTSSFRQVLNHIDSSSSQLWQALLRLLRCVPDARLGLCQKGSQQRSQSLTECSRILPDARSGADSASARHVGARVRQTWHRKAKRSSAACRVILYDVWIRAIEWHLRSR